MFPLPANIYFEIAAFIASAIFWHSLKVTRLHWLMPYLLFIVLIEFSGRYITTELHNTNNGWLYNISVPVEYLFYGVLFYQNYDSEKYQKIGKLFLVLFPLFVVLNLFLIQGFKKFNNNILKVGDFSIILLCCLYFFDLLKIEKIINPLKIPMFWITSGLLIFSTGELVYISISSTLFSYWGEFRSMVKAINNNLIYILYSSLIIGIISSKWDQGEKILE